MLLILAEEIKNVEGVEKPAIKHLDAKADNGLTMLTLLMKKCMIQASAAQVVHVSFYCCKRLARVPASFCVYFFFFSGD